MAHYAQLDSDNNVIFVFVGRDEDDLVEGVTNWETYYAPEGSTVKRTSYNTRGGVHYDAETGEPSDTQEKAFRKNYAAVGFRYDADLDAFIPDQPSPVDGVEWVLNEETCLWELPEL